MQASISRSTTKFRTSILKRRTISRNNWSARACRSQPCLLQKRQGTRYRLITSFLPMPPSSCGDVSCRCSRARAVVCRRSRRFTTCRSGRSLRSTRGRRRHRWCQANASSCRAIWCRWPKPRGSRRPSADLLQVRGSASWQKWNQHRHAATVRSVSFRAEFRGEKALFHARLLPEAESDQHRAEQCCNGRNRNTRRQHGPDKPGIDRMANQSVRAGVDAPMAFLARDSVRPEAPEMNSRPPREQRPRQGQCGEHICTAAADVPERLLSQDLLGPWCQKDGAHENGDTVSARVPGSDVFFSTTGKERSHRPADEPRSPDKRK